CRDGGVTGWSRGAVVAVAAVVAGHPGRGRVAPVRVVGGPAWLAWGTTWRQAARRWRAVGLNVVAVRGPGAAGRPGRCGVRRRPGRRAAGIGGVRRRLPRARPAW